MAHERFIGRDKELGELLALSRRPGPQFLIVYGRRRIGKTTLLLRWSEQSGLVQRLAEGLSRPLTLISAQPGSGKTTLLAEWRASEAGAARQAAGGENVRLIGLREVAGGLVG